jgi:DNA-binding response OmpR family regulator
MASRPAPRVLIVEDNSLLGIDLQDILEAHGCEVVGPSATVSDATTLIRREKIDVALIDYLLGDVDAAPLARLLNDKAIPFALCTGMREQEMSLRYPHTPILAKPYNPIDVCRVVDSLIAARLASS